MPKPDIVAHRGGSVFPENSSAAFKYACTLGVEQLEFNVHLSRDDELVVIHDFDLDQTTLSSGPVRERTVTELAAVRLRGIDEGVPSFDELMAYLATQSIRPRIEIKTDDRPGAYAKMYDRIMRALVRHDMTRRATVMAFDLEALPGFISDGIDTSLTWMNHGEISKEEFEESLAGMRALGISDIGLSYGATTHAILQSVAAYGLTAGVWTVNGPGRLHYWLRMPVSYIITDQPELASHIREAVVA